MRGLSQFRILILCLCALSLAGCGVTKLWGGDASVVANTARTGPTLREQAAGLADPVWEIEEKRSIMSQMAGVLVNGARSAGQALDVFDWTGSESPETRQAKKYLEQIGQRDNYSGFVAAVVSDIKGKNKAARAFTISGTQSLDYYHNELEGISKVPDGGVRKDRRKALFNDADEDRRAAIQASKSLRQQASVFQATSNVLKSSDDKPDTQALDTEVSQLLLKADELRALADELDLD